MPFDMIVLVKQVPDVTNITGDTMKEDGTVNRTALPTVFNPEDLNALEMALQVKEQHGGKVTVLTMGPPMAAKTLREALLRGADDVVLATGIAFAAADTLATSYALCQAIERIGRYDLVFCGRQAIDGDTAQTGPQVAGRLGIPQLTYAQAILELDAKKIKVRRDIEGGYEVTTSPLPALLTVVGSANEPRPPRMKLLMRCKKARTVSELAREAGEGADVSPQVEKLRERGLLIPEWGPEEINAEIERCGASGSPTRVLKAESVVLVGGEHKKVEPTESGVREFINELVTKHLID